MTDVGLTGRRIVVTGGASGIGTGLVRGFAARGAALVSMDLDAAAGRSVAQEAGAEFVRVDVGDRASVVAAFDQAAQVLGGLDVLVHAAGIAPSMPAEQTDDELWERVLRVNATGTLLTNQAAFQLLRDGGGAILNFASSAGLVGLPNKAAYAASKGAVLAWTRTAASEWGRYGVTVNAVAPAMWTPMYDKTRSEMTAEQLVEHDALAVRTIPIGGRLGDVQADLVPVLAFYASAGARFVTGQTLCVDGGAVSVR